MLGIRVAKECSVVASRPKMFVADAISPDESIGLRRIMMYRSRTVQEKGRQARYQRLRCSSSPETQAQDLCILTLSSSYHK